MKRYLSLIIICFAALHMLAAEQVTIDARDLKLYEGYAGFPLYILQMEASGSTAQIRLCSQQRRTMRRSGYLHRRRRDGDNRRHVPCSAGNRSL